MNVLPQLIDPASYRPCDWDLKRDRAALSYWIDHFCQYLDVLTPLIATEYPAASPAEVEAFRDEYLAAMEDIESYPKKYEQVDIFLLVHTRESLLRRHGFRDPFRQIKQRENAAALELLPELIAELDAQPPEAQVDSLAAGLMAGNLFDLGSSVTLDRYRRGTLGFRRTRVEQARRPWLVDDRDHWRQVAARNPGYRHAIFFVDNAGSDFCLGCIPFIRSMLCAGARVTLAANSEPALNDVTAPELDQLLMSVATIDPVTSRALGLGRLRVVASGGAAPLINLTALSPECVRAAADADLLVLHGMGRAIESNRLARFRSDVLRTAVLKDGSVARHVGGRVFDGWFQYTPAACGTRQAWTG